MLSRDELKAAIRGPVRIVFVPEWNGEVGIRRLSAADLVKLRELIPADEEPTEAQHLGLLCETLAMGLCDDAGDRMFEPSDLLAWDGTQRELLFRLLREVHQYNGMGIASEGLAKNSESEPMLEST